MKKAMTVVLGLLLAVGILVVAGWGIWAVVTWFFALDPATATPVAALTGVLLVPVITYFTSRGLERRRSLDNAIREHKTKLDDDLMRGLMRMLNIQKDAPMSEAEMLKFFADVTPQIITYGSRPVINAWNGFRRVSREKLGDSKAILFSFEDLLKAMRRDLGHSVLLHQQGELLGVFVNDVDTLTKKAKKPPAAS